VSRARLAALVVLILALVFAVQGGEYSTWDWLELRRAEAREEAAVQVLRKIVDSLEKEAVAIERDPRVQERVAREAFGMIREGEFLYRIVPPREP
jgi:cell division protein FtsB